MNAPAPVQFGFAFPHELIVDLFAGGGGASEAIRQAFGRDVDIAVNHDPDAVAMHTENHPNARHYCEDVYAVDPREAAAGRPVGLLHASPDCTHFSQAGGGQPRRRAVRSLSWVVRLWAGTVRPRVISLENVEQILQWSPLVAKRDQATRRVVKLDRTVAAPGERVPIDQQFLVPRTSERGRNWKHFVESLRGMGYAVQWKALRACDYGAGTTRRRLFMVARCDGLPIRWPKPTHGKGRGLQPFVTAADCIDWTIPCPSIFGRKRDLADATLRRIARGVHRFVLTAADPFIVRTGQTGGNGAYCNGVAEPLTTVTSKAEHCLLTPYLVPRYGERPGQDPRSLSVDEPAPTVVPTGNGGSVACAIVPVNHAGDARVHGPREPLRTITGGRRGEHAAVVAYVEQANGGPNGHAAKDRDAREPLSTIIGKGCTQRVVAVHLAAFAQHDAGAAAGAPLKTVMAGSARHAVVECSPEHEAGALRVAAFLMRYYGTGGQWGDCRDPVATVTPKDRLALVTVTIRGEPYVIVDIGLRMLTPAELFRCQGFPVGYSFEFGQYAAGRRRLTKTQQVRMVGNSVSPPPMRALIEANVGRLIAYEREARIA